MIRYSPHIIQKQILELKLPAKKNTHLLVDKIKNTYYEKTVPRLNTLFSEMVKDDLIIRLNRIEVNIGHISEDQIESMITGKILQAVKEELEKSLQFNVKDSNNIQLIPSGESTINIFIYFLGRGHFPWWGGMNDLVSLETEIIRIYDSGYDFPASLIELIQINPKALSRLNFQFSASFKYFLIERIRIPDKDKNQLLRKILPEHYKNRKKKNTTPESEQGSEKMNEATVNIQPENPETKKETSKVLKDEKTVKQNILSQKDTAEQNINNPIDSTTNINENILEEKNQNIKEPYQEEPSATGIPNEKETDYKEKPPQTKSLRSESAEIRMDEITDSQNNSPEEKSEKDHLNQDPFEYESKPGQQPESDWESMYPELSGLVILHPFIVQFFESFGLIKNNLFINKDALQKGVQLLGYIALGKKEIEEQFLLLPKFLCGMDYNEPVEKDILLTSEEEKEIDELLSAVISYWGALKNTSPAGLRNTFLKRKGKLSPREGGWQLEVEPKAWDILLNKLPWGISIVKLPWMKEILYINWQ